jgi:hypothetical protein
VRGGTFDVTGTGASVQIAGAVDVTNATFQAGALVDVHALVLNGGTVAFRGSSTFSGTLEIIGSGSTSGYGSYISGGTGRFTNAGDIVDRSTASGGTLLRAGQRGLVNTANGVIDGAAGTMVVGGWGATIVNNGAIEATGSGNLEIDAQPVNGAGGGIILASGAHATVTLTNADIIGGTLDTLSGGRIVAGGYQGILDGRASPVTNQGRVQVAAGYLTLVGSIVNSGAIQVGSAATRVADLLVGPGVTSLSGAGTINLYNGAVIELYGGGAGAVSLVNTNETISGGADNVAIGGRGTFSMTNESGGLIDATGSLSASSNSFGIILHGGTLVNDGVMESTSGELLIYNSTIDQTGGGEIVAKGSHVHAAGAGVVLLYGADIIGGTLTSTAGLGGVIKAGGNNILDGSGSAVTNAGYFELSYGMVTLKGDIINSGTLRNLGAIDAAGVTLSGHGRVEMTGSGSTLSASAASGFLTNFDNTISGGGNVGSANLSLINDAAGVIDGDGVSGGMLLQSAQPIQNAGLIEARQTVVNGGTVSGLLTVEDCTIAGAGAVRVFTNSEIVLDDSSLTGGSLSIFMGGSLTANGASGSTVKLQGAGVANAGTLEGGPGGLTIVGRLYNTGTLLAAGGALKIGGPVSGTGAATISGGGTLETDGAFSQNVTFTEPGAGQVNALVLGRSLTYGGTISGVVSGAADYVDLDDLAYNSADEAQLTTNGANSTITIFNAGTPNITIETLQLAGAYGPTTVYLGDGAAGETTVSLDAGAQGASTDAAARSTSTTSLATGGATLSAAVQHMPSMISSVPGALAFINAMAGFTSGHASTAVTSTGSSASRPAMLVAPHTALA